MTPSSIITGINQGPNLTERLYHIAKQLWLHLYTTATKPFLRESNDSLNFSRFRKAFATVRKCKVSIKMSWCKIMAFNPDASYKSSKHSACGWEGKHLCYVTNDDIWRGVRVWCRINKALRACVPLVMIIYQNPAAKFSEYCVCRLVASTILVKFTQS